MARNFDGSADYLQNSSGVPISGYPYAMGGWFRLDAGFAANGDVISLHEAAAIGEGSRLTIEYNAGSPFAVAGQRASSSQVDADHATTLSTGVWYHGCAIFVSDTDRRILVDAAGEVTQTSTNATNFGSYAHTTIGAYETGTIYNPWDGDLAECFVYDLSGYAGATDSDRADTFIATVLPALAAATAPKMSPNGLVFYCQVDGSSSPEPEVVGGLSMTLVSAPAAAEHPRLISAPSNVVPLRRLPDGGYDFEKDDAAMVYRPTPFVSPNPVITSSFWVDHESLQSDHTLWWTGNPAASDNDSTFVYHDWAGADRWYATSRKGTNASAEVASQPSGWYHVFAVVSETFRGIWINGTGGTNTDTRTVDPAAGGTPRLCIGGKYGTSVMHHFDGKIYNIGFWDTDLTNGGTDLSAMNALMTGIDVMAVSPENLASAPIVTKGEWQDRVDGVKWTDYNRKTRSTASKPEFIPRPSNVIPLRNPQWFDAGMPLDGGGVSLDYNGAQGTDAYRRYQDLPLISEQGTVAFSVTGSFYYESYAGLFYSNSDRTNNNVIFRRREEMRILPKRGTSGTYEQLSFDANQTNWVSQAFRVGGTQKAFWRNNTDGTEVSDTTGVTKLPLAGTSEFIAATSSNPFTGQLIVNNDFKIRDIAIWDADLSDEEIWAFLRGLDARAIRPESLILYDRLRHPNSVPVVNRGGAIDQKNVVQADNVRPEYRLPSNVIPLQIPAVAAGLSIARLHHHYAMMHR